MADIFPGRCPGLSHYAPSGQIIPEGLTTPLGGGACHVELYELNAQAFARFIAAIPAPLGLGKIELADGRRVNGFIGEADIPAYAHDISHLADWRKYTRA